MPRKKTRPRKLTEDDVRVCDCAGCGCEMVSQDECLRVPAELIAGRVVVACRLAGRPYCSPCSEVKVIPCGRGDPGWLTNDSPYQQNAIRHLEDCL